jgi:hypothetical protein
MVQLPSFISLRSLRSDQPAGPPGRVRPARCCDTVCTRKGTMSAGRAGEMETVKESNLHYIYYTYEQLSPTKKEAIRVHEAQINNNVAPQDSSPMAASTEMVAAVNHRFHSPERSFTPCIYIKGR